MGSLDAEALDSGRDDDFPRDAAIPFFPSGLRTGDEAVEVVVELVSRGMARLLGLTAPDPLSCGPDGVSTERDMREKIAAAARLLDAGRAEDALSLAQEAVRGRPTLSEARIVMARAFMGLGDRAKALSILQALPRGESASDILHDRSLATAESTRPADAETLPDPGADGSGPKTRVRGPGARLRPERGRARQPVSGFSGLGRTDRPTPLPRRERRHRRGGNTAKVIGLAVIAAAILIGGLLVLNRFAPIPAASPRSGEKERPPSLSSSPGP